jgi:hypothetical protein
MSWSNQTNSLQTRVNRTCWRWRQKGRRARTTAENFTEMPGTCAGTARPEVKNLGGPSPVLPHATGATQPDIQANNLHAAKIISQGPTRAKAGGVEKYNGASSCIRHTL